MQDLMAEQVRLEEEMASLGIDKYRADFHKSLNDGKAADPKGPDLIRGEARTQ